MRTGKPAQSFLLNCLSQVTKSVISPAFVATRRSQEPDYDEVSWQRHSETPEMRRAAMSPWDAVAQFGHVEPAFEHLHQSSSSFIPRQSTSQHQTSKHTTAATDLSSSYNHLTSPVNGIYDGFLCISKRVSFM